jgi:hypothetical protein
MATQMKPTTKNSPRVVLGKNRNNKPADDYAKNGESVKDGMEGVLYATDPNTLSSAESTPGGMPARRVSIGNLSRGSKTEGIEMRGTGAAIKGKMSRGPMA